MIVLDASILIKWFVKETDSEIALRFKDDLLTGKEDITIPGLQAEPLCKVKLLGESK